MTKQRPNTDRESRTINSRGQGNTGENYQKQDWQWDIGENNKATRKAGKQEWEVKRRQYKATRDYQNKTGKTKTDHDSWGSVFVPLPISEFHSGHLKQKKCFFLNGIKLHFLFILARSFFQTPPRNNEKHALKTINWHKTLAIDSLVWFTETGSAHCEAEWLSQCVWSFSVTIKLKQEQCNCYGWMSQMFPSQLRAPLL